MHFIQLYIDSNALCSLQPFVTCLISMYNVGKSADFVLTIKTTGIVFWRVVKSVYRGFVSFISYSFLTNLYVSAPNTTFCVKEVTVAKFDTESYSTFPTPVLSRGRFLFSLTLPPEYITRISTKLWGLSLLLDPSEDLPRAGPHVIKGVRAV